MNFDDIRHGLETLKDSFADGWDRLRRSAAGALTRFRPGETTQLPARDEIDDVLFLSGQRWAMLGGDVFEDDNRLVVRIEAPGMEKDDFDVQVAGDHLVIRGEKRFERESTEGRWRLLQCAYGSFERNVALPVPVKNEEARATYKNGVLKIELPKVQPGRPSSRTVRVD
jgi:HSP20 family protein